MVANSRYVCKQHNYSDCLQVLPVGGIKEKTIAVSFIYSGGNKNDTLYTANVITYRKTDF